MSAFEGVCFYSVVRYVADPIRNEPRNIGVVVVDPETGEADGRFMLSRTSLPPSAELYNLVRRVVGSLGLPQSGQVPLFEQSEPRLTAEALGEFHATSTNTIQFTAPLPSPGRLSKVRDEVFQIFVAPKHGGSGGGWSTSVAAEVFARRFKRADPSLEKLVVRHPEISVPGGPPFVFDLGIGNGRWHTIIENASLGNKDLQVPEQRAAWLGMAWEAVRTETEAQAVLFVELAEGQSARYERIARWMERYEVQVVPSDRAEEVADRLAQELILQEA